MTKLRIDTMAWLYHHRGRSLSQAEIAVGLAIRQSRRRSKKPSKQSLHQSLQRMVKDGLIDRDEDSSPIRYRPLLTKKQLQAEIESRNEGHTPDLLDWTG